VPHGPRERPLIEESLAKGPGQFLCVLMGVPGCLRDDIHLRFDIEH
jgi:hypothetical protein